jgi:hypothetical protein
MTPKEKAEELVENYDETLTYLESKLKAKQCALIAVDEILKSNRVCCEGSIPYKFWQEVKQEILLDDIFNDEKRQGVKELIDKHKQERSYSEEEVVELLQKALTHKDDGEIGSLVTAQGEIRPANFFSWFNKFKKK